MKDAEMKTELFNTARRFSTFTYAFPFTPRLGVSEGRREGRRVLLKPCFYSEIHVNERRACGVKIVVLNRLCNSQEFTKIYSLPFDFYCLTVKT
ncbi:hypothetical protein EGR_10195 [Echinococcus granulosus]|uniref:Uncharacterized protein n=1 Tax=Echinococcus granulosus TaxID=6210 RepID=W6U8X0_ECHGR|nr:hypothetical protein EGR_10195 [Echinococcus granulosus]EUB54937.1 hypothetical protein EGR_10195 [Echinococcus granulosus]